MTKLISLQTHVDRCRLCASEPRLQPCSQVSVSRSGSTLHKPSRHLAFCLKHFSTFRCNATTTSNTTNIMDLQSSDSAASQNHSTSQPSPTNSPDDNRWEENLVSVATSALRDTIGSHPNETRSINGADGRRATAGLQSVQDEREEHHASVPDFAPSPSAEVSLFASILDIGVFHFGWCRFKLNRTSAEHRIGNAAFRAHFEQAEFPIGLVIGISGRKRRIQKETFINLQELEANLHSRYYHVSRQMKKQIRQLRGFKRFTSLKFTGRFDLYKVSCHYIATTSYHSDI